MNELVFLQISKTGRYFHKLGPYPTPHLMEEVVQLLICNHPDTCITAGLAKVEDESSASNLVSGSWEMWEA